MIKMQQYTFVCAPQPFQWAGVVALESTCSRYIDDYRHKRDFLIANWQAIMRFTEPGGAFYFFPRAPWGTASEFVAKAIENQLLIIPGNIFSQQDTHFRISYAAHQKTLERGVEVLRKLAGKRP